MVPARPRHVQPDRELLPRTAATGADPAGDHLPRHRESARISLLVYAAFFSSVIVIYEGVSAIDDVYIRAARALGATELELFRRVAVPLTVPQIFVAVRVALGVCWATLVAAELVAAQRGIGAMMGKAINFFRMEDVFAGIILIGVSALVMDRIVQLVMARTVRWQERVAR